MFRDFGSTCSTSIVRILPPTARNINNTANNKNKVVGKGNVLHYALYLQHDFACKIENVTSSELLKNSTCGCFDEPSANCTWGTIQNEGRTGDTLALTFCDMSESNDALPGVVST